MSFDSIALPCEGYKGFAGEMLGAEQGVCIHRGKETKTIIVVRSV